MNNIISKVAASVLLAGIAISSVNAQSQLVTDGNVTDEYYNTHKDMLFPIDIKGAGTEANLTFIPNINATPGSGFTLKFENSGYAETSSLFLCVNGEANNSQAPDTIVGNMFSKGPVINGVMTAPKFQFKNDANESLIKDGTNIFFRTSNDCTKLPQIIGVGGSCLPVTAQVVDGITTQSTPFPDYDTDKRSLGETKRMIRIACKSPVCQIDATKGKKDFTLNVVPAGINSNGGGVVSGSNTVYLAQCPECDQLQKCTTYIEIENNSSKYALDTMKFEFNFMDEKGVKSNDLLKLKEVEVHLDNNESKDVKIDGSTLTLSDLNITGQNNWLRITYTPTTTDVIPSGTVSGRIFDLDTNKTDSKQDVIYDKTQNVATFVVAGLTKFTVPYMNTHYKTFVKITTRSKTPAELSAVITDQTGKKAEVTLDDIPAEGTVYLFSTHGPLAEAAKAAGLKNAWTVDFTTSGAATVDAYMTTPNGERRVEAFD